MLKNIFRLLISCRARESHEYFSRRERRSRGSDALTVANKFPELRPSPNCTSKKQRVFEEAQGQFKKAFNRDALRRSLYYFSDCGDRRPRRRHAVQAHLPSYWIMRRQVASGWLLHSGVLAPFAGPQTPHAGVGGGGDGPPSQERSVQEHLPSYCIMFRHTLSVLPLHSGVLAPAAGVQSPQTVSCGGGGGTGTGTGVGGRTGTGTGVAGGF